MVFASLVVVGVATLLQVRRLGSIGGGAVLPMFTAAFAIPFCITAVVDGGPATLTTLVLVSAVIQLIISKWLFILRRIVTPTVGGTVMMILSITLASVVFGLLDRSTEAEPVAAPLTALATLVIVVTLTLRGSAVWRLWGPLIGIVGGCIVAAIFGIYDIDRVIQASWVGLPNPWPGLGLDFGITFWTLLPSFLFLGVIISIQTNGASIAMQRVSWRQNRAVDFRRVQGALAGTGVTNLMAGITGAVPNIINPGIVSFTQITSVASRRVGYCIGCVFIVLASSDGPVADLEFIGGGNQENIEDQVRQLQQHGVETPVEQELSLRLLRSYASSVEHQQYHDTDIITIRVDPPKKRQAT